MLLIYIYVLMTREMVSLADGHLKAFLSRSESNCLACCRKILNTDEKVSAVAESERELAHLTCPFPL